MGLMSPPVSVLTLRTERRMASCHCVKWSNSAGHSPGHASAGHRVTPSWEHPALHKGSEVHFKRDGTHCCAERRRGREPPGTGCSWRGAEPGPQGHPLPTGGFDLADPLGTEQVGTWEVLRSALLDTSEVKFSWPPGLREAGPHSFPWLKAPETSAHSSGSPKSEIQWGGGLPASCGA